jgi:ubiquinone/menaquinone biosynthesis C-methylase UbiE
VVVDGHKLKSAEYHETNIKMVKTQKFWDKQAKKYDKSEKEFEPVYRGIIAMTKEFLKKDDKVLDFGCATGTKTLELAHSIKQIHGLDISVEMINEAIKKKNESKVLNASFSQGTIFNEDLKKSSFDKIIAYGIVHLLEDSQKVIQRIHELLKPGGLFISTTACFKDKMDFNTRLQVTGYLLMKRLGVFPLHLNLFKASGLEQLIRNLNFKIVKTEKIFSGMTICFIAAEKC